MPRDAPLKWLVIGASGFLGRALAHRLVADGTECTLVARHAGRVAGRAIDILDAAESRRLARIAEGHDVVCHLAWATVPGTAEADPRADLVGSLVPLIGSLEAARDAGVPRFLFPSSAAVYGVTGMTPTTEDVAPSPRSTYGIHKLAAEAHCRRWSGGARQAEILRIANPYGPDQTGAAGQGLLALAIQHARSAQPLSIWGDGSAVRDYVFVDDVADAFVRAASRGRNGVHNIGSGQGVSVREAIAAVEGVLGRRVPVEHRGARGFEVPFLVLDASRAERDLGWKAATPLAEGLRRTIATPRTE